MGREYEVEKIFTEQLDKVLAGQAVQVAAEIEDDLRTALEFSQRMVYLRPDPRLQFQTVLKVNLIHKLKEREERQASGRPWFWKVLPREPVWQAVTVLAIMIVMGGVLWGTLFRTGAPPAVHAPVTTQATTATTTAASTNAARSSPPVAIATTAAAVPAPAAASSAPGTGAAKGLADQYQADQYLAAEGSTDKSVYQSGEPVQIQVSWRNLTSQNLTVQEYPPIVSLMKTADAQPVYTFAAGKTSRTLTQGETAAYTYTWDQRDAQGNLVSPGNYYIELEEIYFNGQAVKMSLAKPVSFEISMK